MDNCRVNEFVGRYNDLIHLSKTLMDMKVRTTPEVQIWVSQAEKLLSDIMDAMGATVKQS